MATADLDGNGTADVVVADNLSNTIHAFLNDGTGTFEQGMPDFSISTTFESGHVELADLNGDGLPDLIVTHYKTGLITVILSTRARSTPTVTLSGTASQVIALGRLGALSGCSSSSSSSKSAPQSTPFTITVTASEGMELSLTR